MSRFSIVRPVNGFMGFISTYISAFIAIGYAVTSHLLPVTLAAFSVFLVTSGGNIINDIVDIDVDRVNHPNRPLVTGEIRVSSAKFIASAMFAVAIVLSLLISFIATGIVVLAIMLLIFYELYFKKTGLPGNTVISLLIGLIFVFGGISVSSYGKMIFLFVLAFTSNMSREIIKDVEDVNGDKDRITFPKKYGVKKALLVSDIIIGVLILVSFIPYLLKILSIYYLYVVIVADAIFILSGIFSSRNPSIGQKVSKYAMIVGMASFLAGAF
ncbi:4-hyroxybenzoate octaprenyltransferase [Thermoplasma volcanium GSS1]|uniref:4-hyroxybenzoate octaprenyltransferase n=1 Tax=Thermoplasma volcanium (strain ATCC 51530 / DSM 4299 / JCM 9571 / NBRC 15438 / GSS1) TaxID=273116 RepID=Q97AR3_THEVO|nr:UbiA family prenyltransferase [Thermoplasma volcanium]BAB59888.1 4-hyroxybenzoate octaprenyltransferase [Thermoplasma volcanium GSS1]